MTPVVAETMLSALVTGPDVCGFRTSAAVIVADFYSSSLVEDLWGFLPLQAYAQLKNDDWRLRRRLAALDIFNPLNPNVLPLQPPGQLRETQARFRAQARVERHLHPSDDQQITLTAGISDPIPTHDQQYLSH